MYPYNNHTWVKCFLNVDNPDNRTNEMDTSRNIWEYFLNIDDNDVNTHQFYLAQWRNTNSSIIPMTVEDIMSHYEGREHLRTLMFSC